MILKILTKFCAVIEIHIQSSGSLMWVKCAIGLGITLSCYWMDFFLGGRKHTHINWQIEWTEG